MDKKPITEEERTKYRKGCLTGLMIALAIIVLSSGINQATSFRTNPKKSVQYLHIYKLNYPKEATKCHVLIHVANNNFITVKTNLSKTGEGIAQGEKIKNQILEMLKQEDLKGGGLKILSKDEKTIYDSTTRNTN